MEFWREFGTFADMKVFDVRKMAATRTQEPANGALRVGKWKPFDRD